MIRLSAQDAKRVSELALRRCCNYYNGNCLLLDDGDPYICPQTITRSLCCKWFRMSVLPLDKDLYIKLTKPEHTRVCVMCGKEYIYNSNRMKYCPDCKASVKRRQAAARKRKQRNRRI